MTQVKSQAEQPKKATPAVAPKARGPGASRSLGASDRSQIEAETAGIADRDQLFDTGARMMPPPSQMEQYEGWEGDREERLSAADPRSVDTDIAEEFRQLEQNLSDPAPAMRSSEQPIATPPAAPAKRLSRLSSERLKARAEVLGIAGRQSMDRRQLVEAIKALSPA